MSDSKNNRYSGRLLMSFHNWVEATRIQVETALTMLVERTVQVSIENEEPFSTDHIDQLFAKGLVRVSVPISSTVIWHYLFPIPLAGEMAGLIASGEDKMDYNPDVHAATIGDMILQTVAMLESEIGKLTNETITIDEPEVSDQPDMNLDYLEGYPSIVLRVNIDRWGEGSILKVMEIQGGVSDDDADQDGIYSQPELAPVFKVPEPEPSKPQPRSEARKEQSNFSQTPPVLQNAAFEDFGEQPQPSPYNEPRNLDMLLDVSLPITIELGRTKMLVRDVLDLGPGSVIELDKLSGEPVDLYANDKLFARGEVVVIEENFGVRITELLQIDERLNVLKTY